MGYTTIRERADAVGTFRFISVNLMETLARWVPTTPELEAKILFGRHIWDMAQEADGLGQRTSELRAPLHYNARPTDGYMQTLDALAALTDTAERAEAMYDGVLPDLEARYRDYLAGTNQMQDEPTVRVIERVLSDLARMREDYVRFQAQRPDLRPQAKDWKDRLAAIANGPADFVAFRTAPPQALEV
ncbi:MAG: hypothetical protein HKM89_00150 [Gemmatimonadales bacterium]|nr:hypothetical protein [Gemmatimonadales bacterium]